MADLSRTTAVDLASAIRARKISSPEAVDAAIATIERLNPRLLAFCTPTLHAARADARAIEKKLAAGEPVGPLAGVPISIKDLILTKGVRTTGGSLAYAELVPDEDDVVVERVRAAGAIVLGKTNVSELGYSLTGDNPVFGVTRNPWNSARSSGGSSAGAAVAVATGMGPIALGSDGGGSIRLPAAFCGVFGFKPSMGRVPLWPGCRDERFPGLSSWESLEHLGPITRTVADAALLASVIAGPDLRDRHSIPNDVDWLGCLKRDIAGSRIGYCPDWGKMPVTLDPQIRALTDTAVAAFAADLGCQVETIAPPWGFPVGQFRTLIVADTDLKAMRALVDRHAGKMSPNIVNLMRMEWTAEQLTDAITFRKAITNQMHRLMQRFDFFVTPTTTNMPPLADKAAGAADYERPLPTFTCIANMTGQPAASVPAGWTADGLPVGLQIMGRHLADARVLGACAAFERARPWADRWPPA